MDSAVINLPEILKNAQELSALSYSSAYNLCDIDIEDYFEDLINNINQNFVGVIALENNNGHITIVDGLKRITTLCLILCALCENYKNTTKQNEDARNKILKRYLLDSDNSPKLKLQGEDNIIYRKILFNEPLDDSEQANCLYVVYDIILSQLKDKKISGNVLFKVVSNIKCMMIINSGEEVSGRDLYLTLNAQKDLSQIDLITDYLKSNNCNGWLDVLNLYEDFGVKNLLSSFVRDFLTVQTNGKVPSENSLYNKFKSYYSQISNYLEKNVIGDNILKYSKYYLKIINANFDDEDVKNKVQSINQNGGQDAYPYLMEVLDDLDSGNITEEMFLEILNMIDLFLQKRKENPEDEVSLDFASLSKELNKMLLFDDYIPDIDENKKFTINELNKLTTFEV